MGPGQDLCSVSPYLGPNCLQGLTSEGKCCKERLHKTSCSQTNIYSKLWPLAVS